ncbi:hypothetical protein ASPWEDRAFT_40195 [Aspergillus wentii DTO 134E9]|uniref:Restriction endonuclease domain-containing protein n=1 Tax=Aspergillus wentii DTO 134E9 TaxID=1073089 RepID=A0A1L9RJI2_ASPWE|nr:uncharacterized protein ASPWEDRAFT_40195 [Aspergillus wentii DTO 134E9]OJJ35063.1 hypothetical protein ASPWEDRAFT_40195 [Aspergillus wentii DTO 134E9]
MQQPQNILSSLVDCPSIEWTSFDNLSVAARSILGNLLTSNESGNQFLILHNIPKHAIDRLFGEERILQGVEYRFSFEGSTGLLKIIPSYTHNFITRKLSGEIEWMVRSMGVPADDYNFGMRSAHYANTDISTGKEPDECFFPRSRRPVHYEFSGWPTLVIEAGVNKSLPRLREAARWWFDSSSGDVRIVLLVGVDKMREVIIEKWQFDGQPYCAQVVVINPIYITGPLLLHFQPLMDRPPVRNETDLVLDTQALRNCGL